MISFTLDGRAVSGQPGDTILEALRRDGVCLPDLCDDDKLDPYGGCRLCLVSVDSLPRPVPACSTPLEDGMEVSTNGDLPELRRTLVEMLLSEHVGAAGGGRPDELLDHALDLDVERPLVLPDARRERYDDPAALIGLDTSACILCTRCVRYARDVMQCSVLTLAGRGAETRVAPAHGRPWLETDCELCGGCISVCPTGALYERRSGVEARPESSLKRVRTTCGYCGVGCQVDLNVDPETDTIVKVTSSPHYAPNEGDLCVKGRFAYSFVSSPDRLREPLVRGEDGRLRPAAWDEAIEAAASGLARVRHRHGSQSLGVLSSARLTVEENYLIQKLARTALGTNSVHSCEGT